MTSAIACCHTPHARAPYDRVLQDSAPHDRAPQGRALPDRAPPFAVRHMQAAKAN